MQDVLENTGNATSGPQQSGLMSTIFREYRNHFGLFWRVMLPLIIVSFLFTIALLLLFKFGVPGAQLSFSTSKESRYGLHQFLTNPAVPLSLFWNQRV